jgi:hypothetical protein
MTSDHPVGWELSRISEELAEGTGAWRSCSGCHPLNEGHPTGEWSDVLNCHLGLGCRECGGLGAIWDNTDYSLVNEQAPAASDGAERFRLLARHYMKALGEIAIEDDRNAAQLIACEALGSNPSPQVAGTSDLIKALSRLTDNRHSDGVSSLVSPEDRGAIINGCYDLMVASRQAPAPHVVGPADQIISQIETLFPDWRSYTDIVDCIECTLQRMQHEPRKMAGGAGFEPAPPLGGPDYQSGAFNHSATPVCDAHLGITSEICKPAPAATVAINVNSIIAIRNALIGENIEEAYHQLYKAIDPIFVKLQPWAEIEAAGAVNQ